MDRYEIRPIAPERIWALNVCTRFLCQNVATFYLVRKPSGPMDRAESRSRRCAGCARADARAHGIPFPSDEEIERAIQGGTRRRSHGR